MNWHDYFTYDPDKGLITWRERPVHHFDSEAISTWWNSRYAGRVAGCKRTDGYLAVEITPYRKKFKVHRIIWEMVNGPIPEGLFIDHINRIRFDNRINNLRVVTHSENMLNKDYAEINKKRKRRTTKGSYKRRRLINLSGPNDSMLGVSKNRKGRTKPWVARIWNEGKNIYLGAFLTIEEAREAYLSAAQNIANSAARLKGRRDYDSHSQRQAVQRRAHG